MAKNANIWMSCFSLFLAFDLDSGNSFIFIPKDDHLHNKFLVMKNHMDPS